VIADIVKLAQELTGIRETLRGAKRDKRDRLAAYLQQISACLDDASQDLRAGGSATRACGQLHQYAELIPQTIDDTLGRERTDALREGLRAALYVRGIPHPTREQLDQLNWAAGSFAALSDYLRV